MYKEPNLKQEIKIQNTNESLDKLEIHFNKTKEESKELNSSFTYILKLVNHELIESIDSSTQLLKKLLKHHKQSKVIK